MIATVPVPQPAHPTGPEDPPPIIPEPAPSPDEPAPPDAHAAGR